MRILWIFRNTISSFSLEDIGDIVVGKMLVVFSKGLVVFITSSNCRWKSLSEKEYDEYAHNTL